VLPVKFRQNRRRLPVTPLTIGGQVAIVHLTRGHYALVDADAWESLGGLRWVYCRGKGKHTAYAQRSETVGFKTRRTVKLHCAVLPLPPGQTPDHINGNGLDNRRCNLRPATRSQNGHNRLAAHANPFKGTHYNKRCRKWTARIMVNLTDHFLGYFETREEAAKAYRAKAAELQGAYSLDSSRGATVQE
jgi:hypothetical protein